MGTRGHNKKFLINGSKNEALQTTCFHVLFSTNPWCLGYCQAAGATRLLDCEGRLDDEEEQLRFWQAGGMDAWQEGRHVMYIIVLL